MSATAVAILAVGCSSGGSKTPATTPAAATRSVTRTTMAHTPPPATTPAATTSSDTGAGQLSGTWSGRYSGAYVGTFHLTWRQTGSHLIGTITLSKPATTLRINGRVNGKAISFGTVGSAAITYSGTTSGTSMAGTYQVAGSAGGPWSAGKS
ncbi:MAG: hypothetical protein ACRDPG_12170 [Nocardioidaceae bacterium]